MPARAALIAALLAVSAAASAAAWTEEGASASDLFGGGAGSTANDTSPTTFPAASRLARVRSSEPAADSAVGLDSLLAGVGGGEGGDGGPSAAANDGGVPLGAPDATAPGDAALTGDGPPAEGGALPPVGDLPPPADEEEGPAATAPPETPEAEAAVGEEEEGATPADGPPADAPDAAVLADEAASRLERVGAVSPDLLARFKAAFVGGGREGGGSTGAASRFAGLFGRGSDGGEGGDDRATSLLGSLLGGGLGGGGGGPDDASAAAPAPPAADDDAINATAAPSPPTGGEAALALHNALRARHVDTPPLAWSPSIAAGAAKHAARCVFSHSSTSLGENIAMGQKSWEEAVRAWYDEAPGGLNHRSQVVWAGSLELGCGASACGRGLGGGGTLYVCRYSPAGNVIGQTRANVKPLKAGA